MQSGSKGAGLRCIYDHDLPTLLCPQHQCLVVIDIFMKDLDITAVYIPDSHTRYVQPMDSIINKLVKGKISDILEETLVPYQSDDTSIGYR